MKRIFLLAIMALLAIQLHAQDRTLMGRNGRVGFFVSPVIEQGPLNQPWRTSLGAGAGLVLGNAFLGAYGNAGADYEKVLNDDELDRIDLAHAGLWLGFTPFQHCAFHPFASLRLGGGMINIETDYWDDDYYDSIVVAHPEFGIEVNLTSFLRLAGTAGYRWVDGVSSPGLTNDDFTGWTGALTLRLGYFGRSKW